MSIDFQTDSENSGLSPGFFEQRPHLLLMAMILLFLVAGIVRLYHIDAPGVLIDREYTSAIFARAFYFSQTGSVADWQKEIANITKGRQPILEPPITEYLVSLIYWVIGGERLWVAHLLTSIFWLIGGIFFYKAAKMIVSLDAAVIATAYYLLAPLSILISRSFQPDSLMMLLFLISLFGILKYDEQPSFSRLLFAGGITGLALLYRPLVLFIIFGAYTSITIYRQKSWKFVIGRDYLIFMGLSLLPSIVYYGYGIFIAGFLRWKIDSSFRPHLYWHREYWEGWLWLATSEIGLFVFICALLGLPTLRRGLPRALLIGLWGGYMVFGLVFTMHIHTHGYYQAQLIPIVALSFSSLAVLYIDQLKQLGNSWFWWLPVIAALLILLYFDVRTVRESLNSQIFESEQIAQEIGELVNHSSHTVFVSRFYGMPLQYYGELSGTRWPKSIEYWLYRQPGERELSLEERLHGFGYEPEYFIITDFKEFNTRYADLKDYLHEHCWLLFQDEHYLIYDGSCTK